MKKSNNKLIFSTLVFFLLFGFLACSKDTSPDEEVVVVIPKTLTASLTNIDFEKEASSFDVSINTTADSWTLNSSATGWITFSKTSGLKGSSTVKISVAENTETTKRTATITISANSVTPFKITIIQKETEVAIGDLYPNYNTNPIAADATNMSSTSTEIASKINLGWNLGNTLEASGSETAWGNPKATKALIDAVKLNGFNAVRIPCSWNQYLSNSAKAEIKTEWLNRVKEVVKYCTDNDMYVILNIHWDGGWLENNITEAKKDEVNAKQKAFWEQIATHLRDFDEHLLFASANEPAVDDVAGMIVLNSYHQTFIDAVRATGGKNAYRTLVVQGPTTDIEKTTNLMTTLPTDIVENRMMVEVHYYTPWQFAGLTEDASWGKMAYFWGKDYHSIIDTERNATLGEETALDTYFASMKTKFVDKGIPVVLGEFGAIRRTTLTGDALALHLNSRAFYLKYVVKQAKANGLLPFYWDEGSITNHGFGIFKRADNTVFDQKVLDALIEGLN
ncbi:cellulase family glycosylhydrolase [Lutibacter sp.]|uniref:cellulase family glycosylhydrolase n=1 Tax=Lutibacter sp. TaxID=1925666 RepID=UPI001A215A70|nr:cellulase family glycosylhydrolase [Lutibacter sp.]MBI9039844.1 cellulase family glycosylhydrolase [Lutibacter sp.]